MGWAYLLIAIAAEVFSTSALKAADGFTRLWPTIGVIFGYGLSLYFLSLALRSIPVGIAYALWSGIGIVCIACIGYFAYGQRLDAAALAGLALILGGILVINLLSKSAGY